RRRSATTCSSARVRPCSEPLRSATAYAWARTRSSRRRSRPTPWWPARPPGRSGSADVARVALVCEPPDGGVAEHVRALAAGLPAHGHEAVVLGPDVLPFRRDYRHPHRDAQTLAALARAIRGFDLVHAHAAKAGVLARLAAAAARVPAVYTPHCFPFAVPDAPARRAFGLAVERALAPLTDAIVCVCEQERGAAIAARLRPRGRLAVIHNGCPACAGPADPELVRLRDRGPVVGAVAVLRRQKR